MVIVSYVIAIYNSGRTLRECLESIAAQDYPVKNYEILIVDGGSNDDTHSIIRDFMNNHKNVRVRVLNNPHKLSEGKGMGKDQGVMAAQGTYICFLDGDNILMHRDWIRTMLYPLETNKKVDASQSLLGFRESDSTFLKYINATGIEDAFAIPYSLVAQVIFHPDQFSLVDKQYYLHTLNPENVLFGGANGCIFRRSVFTTIKGYTRDVNVSASMADHGMSFAVAKNAFVHHKTSSSFYTFLKKKALYFYRFVSFGYKEENFRWVGYSMRDKCEFYLRVLLNLSLVYRFVESIPLFIKTKRPFWLLHTFYVYYMTLMYIGISLTRIRSYFSYVNESRN